MRAIVHRQYGTPDVLKLEEVERPKPRAGEVLVRVHGACVSVGDHHVITGKPYLVRLSPFGGLPRPRNLVPGQSLAGVVEELGANVSSLQVGDEVMGDAPCGAFAEYIAVSEGSLVAKPHNLSLADAAALPWATAALQGLRDVGKLLPGQRVLVHGASGAVGTWAVQIARALGAEVTGVCSTHNLELVRALGASEVIDYTAQDIVAHGARFDVMLNLVGNRTLTNCRRVLLPRGRYVGCSGRGGDWAGPLPRYARMAMTSWFVGHKLAAFFASPNQRDLVLLRELVEARKAKPVIERRYQLGQVAEALTYAGGGHARGQAILQVAPG